MMKRWQDFLDSLSTKGGNLLVCLVIFIILIPIVLHVFHDATDSGQAVTVLTSTFAAFSGALLAMLNGNSSRQQMQDRVDTATSGQKTNVNVDKVETVNLSPAEKP